MSIQNPVLSRRNLLKSAGWLALAAPLAAARFGFYYSLMNDSWGFNAGDEIRVNRKRESV